MRKKFTLQTNENCIRQCRHCFVQANYTGISVSLFKIERNVRQVAGLVNSQPRMYENTISLTGGDVLLYQSDGNGLGAVIDAIHDAGLEFSLILRGWTDREQSENALSYNNFLELAQRIGAANYSPSVTVSFDTYDPQGSIERAKELSANAINAFVQTGATVEVKTAMSCQSAPSTLKGVLELMAECGVAPNPFFDLKEEASKLGVATEIMYRIAANDIIRAYQGQGAQKLFFEKGSIVVPVTFNDIILDGNASLLNERPMRPLYRCPVAMNDHADIVIRADQGVIPCCCNDYRQMPVIGNLDDEPLDSILSREIPYCQAVFDMQRHHYQELEQKGVDVCTICASTLPKFLMK